MSATVETIIFIATLVAFVIWIGVDSERGQAKAIKACVDAGGVPHMERSSILCLSKDAIVQPKQG